MKVQPIIFLKKNKADFSDANVIATASQASQYAPLVLNRSNNNGWMTTGSIDSDNTTFTIDMANSHLITDIILVNHNFKSFTVKYWDGSSYQDFSDPIAPTDCTDTTSVFTVEPISSTKVQLTILGTQIPDSEKRLTQFIITERIGQLTGWPIIENAAFDLNKIANRMLSGKTFITDNIGAFNCDLSVSIWNIDADLEIVENLHASNNGFLVWLCGGNENQFSMKRQGYRLEDIFLMKCVNNFEPNWASGLYKSGMEITVSLVEATN